MEKITSQPHLTDAELFGLAAPATGEPEALPGHLSQCQACSRALQEWKAAVRALADEEVGELSRRSPDQWRAAEDATMAAVLRSGRPNQMGQPLRWAIGIAASLLVIALAMPRRSALPVAVAIAAPADETALSAADREDDRLLRDVSFLAQGEDTSSSLVVEESL